MVGFTPGKPSDRHRPEGKHRSAGGRNRPPFEEISLLNLEPFCEGPAAQLRERARVSNPQNQREYPPATTEQYRPGRTARGRRSASGICERLRSRPRSSNLLPNNAAGNTADTGTTSLLLAGSGLSRMAAISVACRLTTISPADLSRHIDRGADDLDRGTNESPGPSSRN